jgi:hypothetical protein
MVIRGTLWVVVYEIYLRFSFAGCGRTQVGLDLGHVLLDERPHLKSLEKLRLDGRVIGGQQRTRYTSSQAAS